MRTSLDYYKFSNGELLALNQNTEPPKNAELWQGYDYNKQRWIFNGKPDKRSLDEIRQNRKIK